MFCVTCLALANMNFFKIVFSDGPLPASGDPLALDKPELTLDLIQRFNSVWSFGGLIMTLASKLESIIKAYCPDLKEFGSGLKEKIVVIRGLFHASLKSSQHRVIYFPLCKSQSSKRVSLSKSLTIWLLFLLLLRSTRKIQ